MVRVVDGRATASGALRETSLDPFLLAAAAVLVLTGAWIAASWIDTGYDATCGAAMYPSMWSGAESPAGCQRVMLVRLAIAGVFLVGGIACAITAAHPRSEQRVASGRVFVAAVTLAVVAVLLNESVRSHGLI